MDAFLNPIQFNRAADAAGVDRLKARMLYSEAVAALVALTPAALRERSVPRPLTPRALPPAARGALKESIEKQNAQRAAAVEIELLPKIFIALCADAVADVRFSTEDAPPAPPPEPAPVRDPTAAFVCSNCQQQVPAASPYCGRCGQARE